MKQMTAPLGVYGVLGNHEYYGRAVPEFLQEMDKIDIRILLDEVITIEDQFYLVGRRDKTERDRQSFENLMSTVDKTMPVIAMDHQPFELKQAADAGVDLLLSGHTHRGQMAPNHIVTRRMYELDWGYAQKVHFTQLFLQASDFGDHRLDLEVGRRLYRWKLRLNSRIEGQLITVGPFSLVFLKSYVSVSTFNLCLLIINV